LPKSWRKHAKNKTCHRFSKPNL